MTDDSAYTTCPECGRKIPSRDIHRCPATQWGLYEDEDSRG